MLVGNEKVREKIKGAITAPFHIFLGPSGIGKTILATEYAKNLLCLENGVEGCTCQSCHMFNMGVHPDYIHVSVVGKNKSIKVEDIIPILNNAYTYPTISKLKVVVIQDGHLMTEEAQNKLLKTFEDDEGSEVKFFLTASGKILDTVKSRGNVHKFSCLTTDEMDTVFDQLNINKDKRDVLNILTGRCPGLVDMYSETLLPLAESLIYDICEGNSLIKTTGMAKEKDKNCIFEMYTSEEIKSLFEVIKAFLVHLMSCAYGCCSPYINFAGVNKEVCDSWNKKDRIYLLKLYKELENLDFVKDDKEILLIILNKLSSINLEGVNTYGKVI